MRSSGDRTVTFRLNAPEAQRVELAGAAILWLTWRRSLNDFAPRLFK